MAAPRRAWITVEYNGKNITDAVSNSVIDLTYTDKSSDEADELALNVHDREGHWHSDWYPKVKSGSK